MISQKELQSHLGVESKRIAEWRKKGMPSSKSGRSYVYDPDAVAKWLLKEGIAQKRTFVKKRIDLIPHVGVNRTTLDSWFMDPTFPYYQEKVGPFCIEDVQKWHKEEKLPRHGRGGVASTMAKLGKESKEDAKPKEPTLEERINAEYQQERLESRRIDNAVKRGLLVPVDGVKAKLSRVTGVVAQMLDEQIGVIMGKMPSSIDRPTRKRIEESLRVQTRVIKRMLAEALRDDYDPEAEIYGEEIIPNDDEEAETEASDS